MERNPFARQDAFIRRTAQQAAATPDDRNRGASEADRAGAVTSIDPDSGKIVAYGLVGITTLGEGFRVGGSRYVYGRVGFTTLGEGFRVAG